MSSPSAPPQYTCTLYTDQKNTKVKYGIHVDSLAHAPIEVKTMAGIQELNNNYCFHNGNTIICASSLDNANMIWSSRNSSINIMCNNLDDPQAAQELKRTPLNRLCNFSTDSSIPDCPK